MAKILIVDDSSMSRRMLSKILDASGHQVLEASDGVSALERYFLEKPDLVFLDLTMEGMDGWEVLEQLRRMNPEARVIVATADIQSSTQVMVRERGAQGFVNKPFERESVLQEVAAVLGSDR